MSNYSPNFFISGYITMAFQVLYPDSEHIYDLSATPTTKSTLNSGGLTVQSGSEATSAGVAFEVVYVLDTDTFVATTMYANRMVSQNSDTGTSIMAHSEGTLKINDGQATASQMDASGIEFTTADETARISTADGLTLDASPFNFAYDADISATMAGNSVAFANSNTNLSSSLTVSRLSIASATADSFMSINEIRLSTLTAGGGLYTDILTDRIEIADSNPADVKIAYLTPTQLYFFRNSNTQTITMDASGTKLTAGSFQPNALLDVSGNAGTDGQYLLSNGTNPVWTTVTAPGTPNLADVLAVATAGDAEDQPISNLSSMGFQASSGGQTVLAITAAPSSLPAATFDVLAVPYAADTTSARPFANKYVEIKVAGVSYWMPLFSAPA